MNFAWFEYVEEVYIGVILEKVTKLRKDSYIQEQTNISIYLLYLGAYGVIMRSTLQHC